MGKRNPSPPSPTHLRPSPRSMSRTSRAYRPRLEASSQMTEACPLSRRASAGVLTRTLIFQATMSPAPPTRVRLHVNSPHSRKVPPTMCEHTPPIRQASHTVNSRYSPRWICPAVSPSPIAVCRTQASRSPALFSATEAPHFLRKGSAGAPPHNPH